MEGKVGSVRKGTMADLLVLDSNPLEDISALGNVQMTLMAGIPVYEKSVQ